MTIKEYVELNFRYDTSTITFSLDQDYSYHLYIKAHTKEGKQVVGGYDFKNKRGSILEPVKGNKQYKQWSALLKELSSYRGVDIDLKNVDSLVKTAKKESKVVTK